MRCWLFGMIAAQCVLLAGIACVAPLAAGEKTSGEQCGGLAGMPCDEGEFCKLPPGHCCCDFFGVCTTIPDGCPGVWDPVCGCDGTTYGNECEADAAGVSVDHPGECTPVCAPASDGFGCAPAACSAIPEEQCIATTLHLDISTGAITTLACDCIDFNLCHIDFGDASPFAVGQCPEGGVCTVVGTDTDNDGIDDTFTAECAAHGACRHRRRPGVFRYLHCHGPRLVRGLGWHLPRRKRRL